MTDSETISPDRVSEREDGGLLIDRFLPRFDVTLIEHVVVDAAVAETWQAVRDLDLTRVHTPLMDVAMSARGIPAGLARWLGRAKPAEPLTELKLDSPGLPGWLSLGRTDGQEIVLGAIGRFWRPDIQWYDVTGMSPDEFAVFAEPGWGRIAAGFSLRPYGNARTLVSYEARTATDDLASARRFARYWWLVRPFVRIVMRATLGVIRQDAESLCDGHTVETTMASPIRRWERWLYRGGRPHRVARALNHGAALAYAAGVLPRRAVTLQVPGRHSGRLVSVPLVVADHEGERYLVAMLGPGTQWVRNVHAADGHVVLRHGRSEHVHLEEVSPELRAPVLRRYLACAPGARPHIPVDRHAPIEDFADVAAGIPVFRVVSEQASR
ncbi:hypothetical protein [Amycolatopsis orientalis]|uniref:hypothetical protein n=1 Tax=Amycolatopsis orientalis TaxID=31958 RepID=UPI0004086FDE|nr:hypothetical protein [Amycolatopsis orientalis]